MSVAEPTLDWLLWALDSGHSFLSNSELIDLGPSFILS